MSMGKGPGLTLEKGACVIYDNRGFGASDAASGKPRQEIDPWEQIRD